MKIRVDKFCSLSTSPSWQAWLFNFDSNLYQQFMRRLRESKGCGQNRDIMSDLLKDLEQRPKGLDSLFDFLNKQYPHMLVNPVEKKQVVVSPIFPYYNPNILTYPRRQVFDGDDLDERAKDFLTDKLKGDYAVVDGRAYIEYLDKIDAAIAAKVPKKNWLVAAWRSKSRQS